MDTEQKRNGRVKTLFANEKGFLLIAALTLLTVLTLVGTTAYILSSTDIKIGGNYRNTQLALQVAIAGAERARAKLVSDLYPNSGALVSLSTKLAAVKGPNNVLNGYTSNTDDVALAGCSITAPCSLNGATYVTYLTNDNLPGGDVYNSTTDTNSKVLITSVATGPNNASAKVEMMVYSPAALASSPATIYSRGDITGGGSGLTLTGVDACGAASSKDATYTKDPAHTDLSGQTHITGNTGNGSLNIDLVSYIDILKKGGAVTTLTADVTTATTYGSSTNYVTVYSDTSSPQNDQGLTLQNVTGYGILVVTGDLVLRSGVQWNGVIMASGSVTLNGSPSGISVQGLIFSGMSNVTDISVSGTNNISYNSCNVKNALGAGVRMVNWKQVN